MDARSLILEFDGLKGKRTNWNSHWTEIAERMWPMHKDLFLSLNASSQTNQGDKRNQEIFDSTAVIALGRFGAILDSLLTPRNSFWHRLKPDNAILQKNKTVMDYFEEVNEILFEKRYAPTANFASQNQLQYKSLGAYGTGAMFIDALKTRKGIKGLRYRSVHLSEIYLRENHQGIIDAVCRYYALTARQAFQKFGDKLPDVIKSKVEQNKEDKFFFIHWVMPREDIDMDAPNFKGMPYASYDVCIEGEVIVAEGGYNTFPYPISRYEQESNEAYGRSPAMDVLPAVKTINEQKKTLLKQGHLATDPIILAYDDGVADFYDGTPGSMIPGGISKDGRLLVQPMPVGNVNVGKELMDDERALINDTFLVTLFQILVDNPQQTATEILEKTREKGILLAPTVGRQQSEYLGPMIERELDILAQQGMLPPQPRMLIEAKGEFKITYESPINRTQRAEWASGAMRTVSQFIEVATATGSPELLDYINWDVAAPQIADINGTPSTWLNGQEKIQALRAARMKQLKTQQAIDAAPAMAGVAKATR